MRPSALLREALSDWQRLLPKCWQDRFANVELDFAAFDAYPSTAAPRQFWPLEGTAPNGRRRTLFKPFHDLAPNRVRVVVMGNDPYPEMERATGRSFEQGDLTDWAEAMRTPRMLAKSLRTIALAAAAFGIKGHDPDHVSVQARIGLRRALLGGRTGLAPPDVCFDDWAEQGVLWLNRALTFSSKNEQRAHRKLWAPFTSRVIKELEIEARDRPVVLALWGDQAAQLEPIRDSLIYGSRGLRIVKASHPSAAGLAFFREGNPLARINEALGSDQAIDWALERGIE